MSLRSDLGELSRLLIELGSMGWTLQGLLLGIEVRDEKGNRIDDEGQFVLRLTTLLRDVRGIINKIAKSQKEKGGQEDQTQ